MEFALRNVPTTKFTTLKVETVIVLLVLEKSKESVKSAQPEPFQLQMETVPLVQPIKDLSTANVFAVKDLSPTNLRSVPNVVTSQEPSC